MEHNSHNATLFFNEQGHTLGSLLRSQLVTDSRVIFVAYKISHPLKRTMELRIQTDTINVSDCVNLALHSLKMQVTEFRRAFDSRV